MVREGRAFAASLFILMAGVLPAHPQVPPAGARGSAAASPGTQAAAPAPAVKPDAKRAKQAFEEGLLAEKKQDWATAFENYADAVRWAPDSPKYLLRRELARSSLVEMHVDAAERDAISAKFEDAVRELSAAHSLDPTNTVVSERLAQISALEHPELPQVPPELRLAGEVHLAYQSGTRSFDYRGDTHGAYEEVAHQFGVEVAFDQELTSRSVRFHIEDVDFRQAMQILGNMNGAFWRPLTPRLIFVAANTSQKRRDYDVSAVRTIVLPASDTADQMTQVVRVVRDIAAITRSNLDISTRTLTLRASPQAIAIASELIDELEQPPSELVLEIEVLEVDRNYAHTIGITPPQTGKVFSINSQEVQEAEQSTAGLLSVLEQIFGTPSSLSGLTSAQALSEFATGQLSASSAFPFVVFGGGITTFLARPPGATANLSEMLSLVQHGRRILLRAEDGQPATFFVGERYPVALGAYSPNLATSNGASSIASSSFPIKDYATGKSPSFVATASLRNNGISDLIVANSADNNLSIFLGNAGASASVGDGAFVQPSAPTPLSPGDKDPVWIATGAFNSTTDSFPGLAVANETSNTVSILLGNGDGTFALKPSLGTGLNAPVAIAAADFNGDGKIDLAVVNSGDNSVSIFLGNGDGTFTLVPPTPPATVTLPTGNNPSAIAVGDFNGDGKMDLAVTNANDNTVSVFLGKGDGTFTQAPMSPYAVGDTPVFVSTAQFTAASGATASGHLDLAVANKAGNSVSILLGNGDGTFNTAVNCPAGNGPTSIAPAQFTLSGLDDLAVTDGTDNAISLLINTSSAINGGSGIFNTCPGTATSGSLNQELPLSPDTNPLSIVSADFNGDTRPDAAVVENGTNELSVILNGLNFSNSQSSLISNSPFGAFPNIQYEDIGLKVKATPRVHPDGDVTLKLDIEISSLTNLSNNGDPVINNDSVEQTVQVKQNETATLAGILEPQITSAINGTPGLADVPVIGWLAKNQTAQNQDTELLIMITPRLIYLTPRKEHVIYAGQGSPELRGETAPAPPQPQAPPSPPTGAAPPAAQGPPPAANPGYGRSQPY